MSCGVFRCISVDFGLVVYFGVHISVFTLTQHCVSVGD